MERLNDVIYPASKLHLHNTNANSGLGHLRSPSIPQIQHRATLRPRLVRVNKKVTKLGKGKPTSQIRRQFLQPGTGLGQRPQRQRVAQNALQMSLLLLSILAFGTFATTSIMMRNTRRNNRREQSANRIVIDKAPKIENEVSSSVTNNTSWSFTHWASVYADRLFEFITDFVQEQL